MYCSVPAWRDGSGGISDEAVGKEDRLCHGLLANELPTEVSR